MTYRSPTFQKILDRHQETTNQEVTRAIKFITQLEYFSRNSVEDNKCLPDDKLARENAKDYIDKKLEPQYNIYTKTLFLKSQQGTRSSGFLVTPYALSCDNTLQEYADFFSHLATLREWLIFSGKTFITAIETVFSVFKNDSLSSEDFNSICKLQWDFILALPTIKTIDDPSQFSDLNHWIMAVFKQINPAGNNKVVDFIENKIRALFKNKMPPDKIKEALDKIKSSLPLLLKEDEEEKETKSAEPPKRTQSAANPTLPFLQDFNKADPRLQPDKEDDRTRSTIDTTLHSRPTILSLAGMSNAFPSPKSKPSKKKPEPTPTCFEKFCRLFTCCVPTKPENDPLLSPKLSPKGIASLNFDYNSRCSSRNPRTGK